MAEEKTSGPRLSRAPLLSLDTLTERYVVTVDGESYELRNPGELSLTSYYMLGKKGEELNELLEVPEAEFTDEQVASLDRTLDFLCRAVLDAPDEVHKKLKDLHKLQVIQAFNELPESKGMAALATGATDAAPEAESPPTGESKSPD